MLKCYKHITNIAQQSIGSVTIPGGITKLTGVAVVGASTCSFKRKGSTLNGYRLRLMINNRADNPINIDYQDTYLDVFKNVNENTRLIQMDYNLKPQTKIDYIITYSSKAHHSVKLYLRFE